MILNSLSELLISECSIIKTMLLIILTFAVLSSSDYNHEKSNFIINHHHFDF